MSQLRLNPLNGRWVTVVAARSERPSDFAPRTAEVEVNASAPCLFCPGRESETPGATLELPGPDGRWSVRVVPNHYPAFSGDEPMAVTHRGPVFTEANASGLHEVLVLTNRHVGSWADLSEHEAAQVMEALHDRMIQHAKAGRVRYTQAIVNHGREAGASVAHPHGQLLGIPFVPGEILDEEAGFARFEGSCLLCVTIEAERLAGERVIFDDDDVIVLCPYWSASPFEMLVIPTEHQSHLPDAKPDALEAVGRTLQTVLARLRDRVGDVAYNLVFHTAPHKHNSLYHWHAHVWPRLTTVAGFEQGTGVFVNVVPPEQAALYLNDHPTD
jgi:UDPglucose--hexose-1-phosphate uridylyltransferase